MSLAGGEVPSEVVTALQSALTTSLADSTHTGSGTVDLTFQAADHTFDFLAQGQTLTATYDVTVADGHGGSSTQAVTFTVTGADDAPIVSQAIADQHATMLEAFSFTAPDGTFTDVDSPTLTWTASLANGSALPSWLHFDAATHTFSDG